MDNVAREFPILIAIAAILCMCAILWELRNSRNSAWTTSPLALPFYAAGILQWLVAGVYFGSLTIAITCVVQLIALGLLTKRYVGMRGSP